MYENDPEDGLEDFYFKMLSSSSEIDGFYQVIIKNLFDELIAQKVDVLTLTQGTVDWHRCRQFSLTSSQSDDAIKKAIIVYQNNNDWCEVGQFLEGCEYRRGEL